MAAELQLVSFAAAAVLETVLLVAMIERRNRRAVRPWMLLVTLGAWMWHTGLFVTGLLAEASGRWSAELLWLAMTVMASGLLLIPSALLHGICRLNQTGLENSPRPRPVLALCYLPIVALLPVAWQLRSDPAAGFLPQLGSYVVPYVVWAAAVSGFSALSLWRIRRAIAAPRMRQFFAWLSAALGTSATTLAFVFFFAVRSWPMAASPLVWIVSLLPAIPAALFAYYVIRFQFVPLVLERTLVYGAIVVGLLLAYRVTLQDMTDRLSERYHVDFALLEGGVAIVLILVYQPLRQRIAESLRYLLGSRVATVRGQIRRLAVEMSEHAGQPPEHLLAWFPGALANALHVDRVAAWVMLTGHGPVFRGGDAGVASDESMARLHDDLASAGLAICSVHDAPTPAAHRCLQQAQAAFAVRLDHPQLRGIVLVGPLPWQRQLGEEELNFLTLLAEQLASAIQNSQLLAERQAAERRAFQSEKLATLGLLAGSLAHEIRNPLSSIKTIAAVVSEQLGPQSPHHEDLRLILGEIDRLSATTSQLLEFARPAVGSRARGSVTEVIQRLARLLGLLAAQRSVSIEVQFEPQLPTVEADEQALREIFFNLLSNSIEASRSGGKVRVDCRRENGSVIAAVSDDGPGIPAVLAARLFDPFVTTKEAGTGLGLYTVGRRVRELGGQIDCASDPQTGTRFVVRLPCEVPKSE